MKIIQFRHTKYINYQSKNAWAKGVFSSTFEEYNMQVQLYQQEGNSTFKELLKENPKTIQLNYKMNMAIKPYIEMMNGILLDIADISGKRFMNFNTFDVKIINSQRNVSEKHFIEVNFFSIPYIWLETIGEQLVIKPLHSEENNVFVVKLHSGLTITSLEEK